MSQHTEWDRAVDSWHDFVSQVNSLIGQETSRDRSPYRFRGLTKFSYPLLSSLARVIADHSYSAPDEAEARRIAMKARDRFKREVARHRDHYPEIAGETGSYRFVEWSVFMQHYGAPTPLLDWTRCPFIAAYFAVWHQPDCDGAVWAVRAVQVDGEDSITDATVHKAHHEEIKKRSGVDSILADKAVLNEQSSEAFMFVHPPPGFETGRIAAQASGFSLSTKWLDDQTDILHHLARDMEKPDQMNEQQRPVYLRRFIIPAKLKEEFLCCLESKKDISQVTLFPSLATLGESIRCWLKQGLSGRAGLDPDA